MKKITVEIASYTQHFLIEKVNKNVAETCISGLADSCGGIEAAYTITSNASTKLFNVYAKRPLRDAKNVQAKSFCEGVNYCYKTN